MVGTPHGIVFSRSIRRAPKEDSGDGMLFNSIKGVPWELQPGIEREVVNRVQYDVQTAIPERQAAPLTVGEQLPRRVYIRRSLELARYGYTDRCIGCQHATLSLKPADHSEECRARIVSHMTADDDLNQRVQIAQDRIVETALLEARTGERDSVPEPARQKVRFAERVEEHTPEGTLLLQIHGEPAAIRAAVPVPLPADVQQRLPHRCRLTKAIRTAGSKRRKVTRDGDMELEGLVMDSERDRLQRYCDCDFLKQVKHNADVYLDRIFSNDHRKRETVKKELIQLGVHPSVHVAEVFFKSWEGTLCPQIWSHPCCSV